MPYAPPFGSSFVAWEDTAGRMAWLNRGGAIGPDLTRRLMAILDATRERGYSVERMTPLVNQAPALIVALHSDDPRSPLRTHIEGLIAEIITVGLPTPDEQDRPSDQPVTTIAAPVFDSHDHVVANLSAHPLRPLSAARVQTLGERLVVVTRAIGRP